MDKKKDLLWDHMRSPHSKSSEQIHLLRLYKNKKIRPVLHMSSPKGQSLNDAIDMLTVDKLNMSSPKLLRKS